MAGCRARDAGGKIKGAVGHCKEFGFYSEQMGSVLSRSKGTTLAAALDQPRGKRVGVAGGSL